MINGLGSLVSTTSVMKRLIIRPLTFCAILDSPRLETMSIVQHPQAIPRDFVPKDLFSKASRAQIKKLTASHFILIHQSTSMMTLNCRWVYAIPMKKLITLVSFFTTNLPPAIPLCPIFLDHLATTSKTYQDEYC